MVMMSLLMMSLTMRMGVANAQSEEEELAKKLANPIA